GFLVHQILADRGHLRVSLRLSCAIRDGAAQGDNQRDANRESGFPAHLHSSLHHAVSEVATTGHGVACLGSAWKKISRTSTGARKFAAPFRAKESASSKSAASSSRRPPMCSLVSVNGPSVTATLPSDCFSKVLAVLAWETPQANRSTPRASNS